MKCLFTRYDYDDCEVFVVELPSEAAALELVEVAKSVGDDLELYAIGLDKVFCPVDSLDNVLKPFESANLDEIKEYLDRSPSTQEQHISFSGTPAYDGLDSLGYWTRKNEANLYRNNLIKAFKEKYAKN